MKSALHFLLLSQLVFIAACSEKKNTVSVTHLNIGNAPASYKEYILADNDTLLRLEYVLGGHDCRLYVSDRLPLGVKFVAQQPADSTRPILLWRIAYYGLQNMPHLREPVKTDSAGVLTLCNYQKTPSLPATVDASFAASLAGSWTNYVPLASCTDTNRLDDIAYFFTDELKAAGANASFIYLRTIVTEQAKVTELSKQVSL